MKIGMGLVRKVLFITTFGLSGLVLKDNSKKQRTAQAPGKAARPAQAKARTQKAQKARRSKPKSARAATVAKGTAGELERLAKLHNEGTLSGEEFAAGKAKILGTTPSRSQPSGPPTKTAPAYAAVEANVTAARHLEGLAARERSSIAKFGGE
jgi:multidrug resistance efflux pump